jgi:hypothetical protein
MKLFILLIFSMSICCISNKKIGVLHGTCKERSSFLLHVDSSIIDSSLNYNTPPYNDSPPKDLKGFYVSNINRPSLMLVIDSSVVYDTDTYKIRYQRFAK